MLKLLRIFFATLACTAGAVTYLPGVAQASMSVDVGFVIAPSSYAVGDTDIPVSLTITNSNSGSEANYINTVCNSDTGSPPCASPGVATPANDTGVNLVMSCAELGATPVTCVTPDPGVFEVSATGTGAADTSCAGEIFDIFESDSASATFRFTPQGGEELTLAAGATCIIEFKIDVVGIPTLDQDPETPGKQTAQIADVLGYSGSLDAYDVDSSNLTISRAVPMIVTQASPSVIIGDALSDTAFISGRVFPDDTANVHFDLYGPNDDTCSSPSIFSSDVALSDTQTEVTSAPFIPTLPGTYRWIARYDGDTNNESVSGICNDVNESADVDKGQPKIVTVASSGMGLGNGSLTDTATVTNRALAQPGATVDFRLYGPNDTDCSNPPIFESLAIAISATSNNVTSAAFTPTAPGTYRWIASYSGDINNLPATGECNDVNESADVDKGQPEIVTQTSPGGSGIGVSITDTATVTNRVLAQPGATVDFRLYGPNDADCSNPPIFEDLDVPYTVSGGTVTSAGYTTTTIGTYRWVATYSGDANNESAVGECGDPTETFSVRIDLEVELPATGLASNTLLRTGVGVLLFGLALVSFGSRRHVRTSWRANPN